LSPIQNFEVSAYQAPSLIVVLSSSTAKIFSEACRTLPNLQPFRTGIGPTIGGLMPVNFVLTV
jgi:hypothetical protein